MPFKSRPEDFGQRILGQLECRYMSAEEFDQITENPKPLAETFGPDEELLFIALKTPDGKREKRTFLRAEYSPVAKWVRWVTSWRDAGLEFNADDPSTHNGQWAWLDLKQVSMGKYGSHEVWLFGGVPTPEEIAKAAPLDTPGTTTSRDEVAISSDTSLEVAVTLIPYGAAWGEALTIVHEFMGNDLATPAEIVASLAKIGAKVQAGKVVAA